MHINIFTTLLGIIENIGGAVGEGLMGYGEGGILRAFCVLQQGL